MELQAHENFVVDIKGLRLLISNSAVCQVGSERF